MSTKTDTKAIAFLVLEYYEALGDTIPLDKARDLAMWLVENGVRTTWNELQVPPPVDPLRYVPRFPGNPMPNAPYITVNNADG